MLHQRVLTRTLHVLNTKIEKLSGSHGARFAVVERRHGELAASLECIGDQCAFSGDFQFVRRVAGDSVDVDPGEPCLVVRPSQAELQPSVRVAGLGDDVDEVLESGFGVDACGGERVQFSFEAHELARESFLAFSGDVCGHSALHGVFSPLVPFALDLIHTALHRAGVAVGVIAQGAQVLDQAAAQLRQGDDVPPRVLIAPQSHDGVLDALNSDVRHATFVALGLASGADVVLVGSASSSSVCRVEHP